MLSRLSLKCIILFFAFTSCISVVSSQNSKVSEKTKGSLLIQDSIYFGQEEVGLTPKIFAPGIISRVGRYEFGFVKSRDGSEVYFGVDNKGVMEIYQMRLGATGWSKQEKLFNDFDYSHNDPMLSPDEERLYFISNRPLIKGGEKKDVDIWYSEREGANWSEPINLGEIVNSKQNEYYVSFAANGALYYASRDGSEDAPNYAYDIYRSEYKGVNFEEPVKLPKEINTDRYEADVFVAPDESYLIFCSIRRDGLGAGDLYISFADDDGNWTEAVNMGGPINTDGHELCPFVSQDGKFFFYTSNEDIYWVSTEIFDKYRSNHGK